ncbi:MAG: 4Fe-4S dicluster domain-containing protein [bacterium]|jgi:heterodisulfide reductase subunit C|nr:4Fe-4S dicluster domain-containing protein [bacterium]
MAEKEAVLGVVEVSELDPEFKYEIMKQPGGENITRCFTCGTCPAGCPVTNVDCQYNPKRIIRMIVLGMRHEVLSSPLIWLCELCYRCSAHCPQQVNFTDIMRTIRYMAVKGNHVAPEILEKLEAVKKFSPTVRHDMIQAIFKSDTDPIPKIENVLQELKKNG